MSFHEFGHFVSMISSKYLRHWWKWCDHLWLVHTHKHGRVLSLLLGAGCGNSVPSSLIRTITRNRCSSLCLFVGKSLRIGDPWELCGPDGSVSLCPEDIQHALLFLVKLDRILTVVIFFFFCLHSESRSPMGHVDFQGWTSIGLASRRVG